MTVERGFTLLEVLVAFIIASLALAAVTEAALHGTDATRVGLHMQEAISRARSRLAAVAVDPHPGTQGGDDGGGFAWHSETTPVATGVAREGETARPVLYRIRVDVAWPMDGGRRHVRLDTLRLGLTAGSP